MVDRIDVFWNALGALTYAEMLEIAIALRDIWDEESDTTVVDDWMRVLNTGREAHERNTEEALAA